MSLPELLIHPLVVRTVRVESVEDVGSRVRRVRLGGEQLGEFRRDGVDHPAFGTPGFDDHIKIILASDGDVASALPAQHPDGIEWVPAPNRITRDYTPHSVDPETGSFSLDFVLHGTGAAAEWALAAQPGSELSFVGPKSSQLLPGDATSVLLIGDETALPAIRRFLTERPVTVPAHVVVLVTDQSGVVDIPDSVRRVAMPEPDGEAIAGVLEEMLALPDVGERPFVWAAGEARSLLPSRRVLSGRVDRGSRSLTGYWHIESDGARASAEPELPEPPVAWLAVRAGLRSGVLQALRGAARTGAQVQSELGLAASPEPLLETLSSAGLVAPTEEEAWELTGMAVDLLDDHHEVEEFTGPEADQVLSLQHLSESLTTGRPAWEISRGVGLRDEVETDPDIAHHLEHESAVLVYLQFGLLRAIDSLRADKVVAVGPGAGFVRALAEGDERFEVTGPAEGVPAGAVVSAMLLGFLDDDGVRAHLRALAAIAPRALLVVSGAADGIYGSAGEARLLRFAVTGVPERTDARIAELATECGWTVGAQNSIGWGVVTHALTLA